MKVCPFCAEQIQDAAVVCRFCQRQLPTVRAKTDADRARERRLNKRVLLFLGGMVCLSIVLVIAATFVQVKTATTTSAPAVNVADEMKRAERERLIQQSIDVGIIKRLTCVGNQAYIEPFAWSRFNAQAKEGLTIALAAHCEAKQSGNRITILDAQSGRELAKFNWSGYSVR